MSLPPEWVEKIFKRMALEYGSRLGSLWAGLDPEEVKAHWARELAGYVNAPQALGHALDHMPDDRPPTLPEFRKLCRGAPVPALKALPAPAADVARVSAALARARSSVMAAHGTSWVDKLRAREAAGERLGLLQREALRRADGAGRRSTEGGV